MSKGITRERTGQLLQALLRLLATHAEGMQARNAIDALSSSLTLTDHEKGEYKTGGRRFDKILRFATIDAVKAGWMSKNKGIWSVTEDGKVALAKFASPDEFYREASRLYQRWHLAQPDVESDQDEVPTNREAKITFEEAEEQAWAEIGLYLDSIDPYELQNLVGALLEAMSYHVAWIAPPGKDGGVDLVAWTDPLGTVPPRIKVQVKRRKDNIPAEELRAFLANVNDGDVGIFVTTGGFTRDAEELARSQERRRITLVDSQKLVELWIEYNDKIEKDKRALLPLKPIYFLAPRG